MPEIEAQKNRTCLFSVQTKKLNYFNIQFDGKKGATSEYPATHLHVIE